MRLPMQSRSIAKTRLLIQKTDYEIHVIFWRFVPASYLYRGTINSKTWLIPSPVLRFAHYSVKEYLVSEIIPSGFSVIEAQAHQLIMKISLIYCLSFGLSPSQETFPLSRY